MHCHSTCGSEASHEKQMVFSDSKTSAMELERGGDEYYSSTRTELRTYQHLQPNHSARHITRPLHQPSLQHLDPHQLGRPPSTKPPLATNRSLSPQFPPDSGKAQRLPSVPLTAFDAFRALSPQSHAVVNV
jgi:hypothetical protein